MTKNLAPNSFPSIHPNFNEIVYVNIGKIYTLDYENYDKCIFRVVSVMWIEMFDRREKNLESVVGFLIRKETTTHRQCAEQKMRETQ